MKSLVVAALAATVLAGCAAPHAHRTGAQPQGMQGMGMQGMQCMDMHGHMEAMRERMAAAKTPEERQALMQEHCRMMPMPAR